MKIEIIGGGLAGCAAAYVLKQAGHEPVIYEAAETLAAGASGNSLGLYNPRLSAEYSPQAQYYAYGFDAAREVFQSLCHPKRTAEKSQNKASSQRKLGSGFTNDGIPAFAGMTNEERDLLVVTLSQDDGNVINWNPCGALHLITDEKKDIRFRKMIESWPDSGIELLSVAEASDVANVELSHEALYLPTSGHVSPRKLCAAYAEGLEVRLNTQVASLEEIEADAVILACAAAVNDFVPELPLQTIRGQVTQVKSVAALANLKTCLCYGGYAAPAVNGAHMVGSTFQRWLEHSDVIGEDDQDNIDKLIKAVPALDSDFEVLGHRAAIRTASKDQFPIVGALPDRPNVYVSTAHGSHGIVSSIAAARHLSAVITGQSSPLSKEVIECLMPSRFM